MKILGEFKAFVARGNVIDLAVGVIIGAAFGKIVDSLVRDMLMPVIGLLLGGINFKTLAFRIAGTDETPVNLNYGNFVQTCVDFVIVAAAIFAMVKIVNILHRKREEKKEEPAAIPEEVKLLTEIRDLLKGSPGKQ